MKKSLLAASVALAAALALTGCASHGPEKATASSPSPSSSVHITSYTQVHDLNSAVVWGLTITPQTPDALNEIDHTGALLKQYADADTRLTADQKTQIDAYLASSQSAVSQQNLSNAGGYLSQAAQATLTYLTHK